MRTITFTCLLLLLNLQGQAQVKTAQMSAVCRSIYFAPLRGNIPGIGRVINYTTTYDGQVALPRHDILEGGGFVVSGELRPRQGRPGLYEADYFTLNYDRLIQYGALVLTLPTRDADANLIPDLIQKNRGVDTAISGYVYRQWPNGRGQSVVSGRLRRRGGSTVGNYQVTVSNPVGTVYYSGQCRLVHISGTASYTRGETNRMDLSFAIAAVDGSTQSGYGSVNYTIIDRNNISLPEFTVVDDGDDVSTILPSQLKRTGNRYIAQLTLADGSADTSWQDYKKWILEIRDPNDADGDGIPDLSDLSMPPL